MNFVQFVGYFLIWLLILKLARDLVLLCYHYVAAKKFRLFKDVRSLGTWAVVTGATDGIGKSYAQQLAKRGLNVYLLARNAEKLASTAAEIKKVTDCDVRSLVVDFSAADVAKYEEIEQQLRTVDVGVLANNVGISYSYPEYFDQVPDGTKLFSDMIRVNCHAVTQMTKIFLPKMLANHRGAIINVSSSICEFPSPLLTLYGATKSFVSYFTKSIQEEYKTNGIIIQGVMPFFVVSKMSKIRSASFFVPCADDFVAAALDTLGVQQWTYGCLSHGLLGMLMKYVPERLFLLFTKRYLLQLRKNCLAKKAA